jgi:putative MATE family efflux protein
MSVSNPLGVEKIHKLLIRFSLPAITGMLVSALYNIVDRIFIGNAPDLGANGLAGITVGFPLTLITLAFAVLFGVGGSTLFSIKLGQQREEEARQVMANAFMMMVLVSLLFSTVVFFNLDTILRIFGASSTVLPFARDYMSIILFGALFQVISLGMNNFVRADGSPKIAMGTMLLGAGINIALDPLFIFGFGWGMQGAALATVIAQFISATWVMLYLTGKRARNRIERTSLKLNRSWVQRIVSLGMPSFSLQIVGSVLITVLNRSLFFYGGDIAVSAMGVINSLQTLMLLPIIGMNQGVQPIVSFNYGAQKLERVKQAILLAMMVATGIVVFGFVMTRLFALEMLSVFNRDPELLSFGQEAIRIWFLALPFLGFQILGANFFQAIGRPKSAMSLTLTRQVLLLIPAILIFASLWGLNGLLYAAPFADSLATLLTGFWFFRTLRSLKVDFV